MMNPNSHRPQRILVVDDEADLRELLELTLVAMGFDVDCAADLKQARQYIAEQQYVLCLTDMRLPDGMGLELVEQLATSSVQTPVAVITAYGSADNAVAALKAGAFDYLAKPVALDALRALVRSAVGGTAIVSPSGQVSGAEFAQTGGVAGGFSGGATGGAFMAAPDSAAARMVGDSASMKAVRESIGRLARSMAPVYILGESGSGKELAARMIHENSARAKQAFVAVNCGAIPENLMESEFFGHRKGAFTGADQDRDGFFQAASGGTLFLDEVADLPLAMQVKLLRVIQEKRVRKIGATSEEAIDVRIVSATHQDLNRCVALGRFRQDLFYRLNVIELKLPALRERSEDIPVIAQTLLARVAQRSGMSIVPGLSSVTLKYLQSYPFPGNVRELENILERALAFSSGDQVNVEDLGLRPAALSEDSAEPKDSEAYSNAYANTVSNETAAAPVRATEQRELRISDDGIPDNLTQYLDEIERKAITKALARTRFNRTAAAKLLGISFRALRYRMQRLDIQ
jgi:two-component system, NtrC family, response regulator PilR